MLGKKTIFYALIPGTILFFTMLKSASADTHYVAKSGSGNACTQAVPCQTIATGIAAMSGGDELIIRDGVYVNDPIRGVPSGSVDAYTVIRSENIGQVTIDMSTAGDWEATGIDPGYFVHHIQIEGFKVKGSLNRYSNGPIYLQGNNMKLLRCSAYNAQQSGNSSVINVGSGSDHILIEECWAWGTGRYKFLVYQSTNTIVRRCVARHDYHGSDDGWSHQESLFVNYDSTNTLFQNCIAIDSGVEGSGQHIYGAFWDEHNITAVDKSGRIDGSIVLNIRTNSAGMLDKVSGTRRISNSVIWDSNGGWSSFYPTEGPVARVYLQNNTFGELIGMYNDGERAWGTGASDSNGANVSLRDSIIYGANSYGVAWEIDSDYNSFYNNFADYGEGAFAGMHDYSSQRGNAFNPVWNVSNNPTGCLKHLLRTEDNSNCSAKSSLGGKLGAQIIYKQGVDGALYGEAGYDILTSEPLWPFPNEDLIRSDFASYAGPGPSGARGFAAGTSLDGSPQTLTKYIWEYLGNQIPCEIYGTCGGDASVPGNPSGLLVR